MIVDVHPDYWCLDPAAVERALSARTKAIVAVHVYGHPADMDPLLELARPRRRESRRRLRRGSRRHVPRAGSSAPSETSGVSRSTATRSSRPERAAWPSPTTPSSRRGCVSSKTTRWIPTRRYFHPEAGFNCRMTNIQAALGCAQLERIDRAAGQAQSRPRRLPRTSARGQRCLAQSGDAVGRSGQLDGVCHAQRPDCVGDATPLRPSCAARAWTRGHSSFPASRCRRTPSAASWAPMVMLLR